MKTYILGGKEIRMEQRLYDNLVKKKQDLQKKDEHCILIIDGPPGVGKSTLAQQCAAVIDDDFAHSAGEKIHNTVESFIDYIVKCPKKKGGVAAILDEGLNGANAKRAMSSLNVMFHQVLAEIRQKNMFLIVCAPFIFELDKSLAVGLSDGLIHCYKSRSGDRTFRFYGRAAKLKLYLNPNGKKFYQYGVKSTFYGSMGAGYIMDEAQYRRFKNDALKKYISKDGLKPIVSSEDLVKKREAQIFKKMKDQGFSYRQMEQMGFGSHEHIRRRVLIAEEQPDVTDTTSLNSIIPLKPREVLVDE